ncbi:dTDP-4-dehydrorhamnose 3,5-epimerase family protein [Streptomyces sp. NPDC097619]|uniref:dTDP-4-dehydrorhamnose 3,5-epimerase family protein n=1 Tax=Streptomyces sp. NPDC097619 TaxID=3157228 RepID=UPI00331FA21E
MHIADTAVPGAYLVTPRRHIDERGDFFEGLRTELLEARTGHPFAPRQINYSTSRRNTLRGVHGVTIPPGQAKYVTCVRGALRDIVVDLRVGSPTFGAYATHELDPASGTAVYVPEGVGHGFLTLTDDTTICYVLSTAHVPGTQIDIDPLDPDLALPWGFTEPPLMSAKDAAAPGVREAEARGLLAPWRETGREAHTSDPRKVRP